MAELRIPIIGEFKGKKAFDQAGKATSGLDKGVKKLGKTLAVTFGASQLLKFAKNAAAAFIEDQKQATRLAQVVKNLGIAFEAPAIEDYISKLSRLSGVTDSDLRPAMQTLLQITGSVTQSQKMLGEAIDISAATGVDLATVAQDLGRAYTGNTKGLKKYNLGLTQAELTAASYVDIQKALNKTFGGSNAAQLETYAGQMSLLSVATAEASETIGKSLIDALITVTNSSDVTDFIDKIDSVATAIGNAVGSISRFIRFVATIPTASGPDDPRLAAIFDPARLAVPLTSTNVLSVDILREQNAARRKAEEEAAKRAKELAAMQAKSLALQKKNLALQKASKTLNLDAIGIEAALKGKISETDRISLELQKAILNGNATLAEKLAKDLEAAVKRNNELRLALLTTPEAPNPYRNWKPPEFGKLVPPSAVLPPMPPRDPNAVGPVPYVPPFNVPGDMGKGNVGGALGLEDLRGRSAAVPQINITVELDGQTVGGAIRDGQINDSLSGSFSQLVRGNNKGAVAL